VKFFIRKELGYLPESGFAELIAGTTIGYNYRASFDQVLSKPGSLGFSPAEGMAPAKIKKGNIGRVERKPP